MNKHAPLSPPQHSNSSFCRPSPACSDRAWVLLVGLHNDALMDRPNSRQHASPYSRPEYKRRNSDPLLTTKGVDFDLFDASKSAPAITKESKNAASFETPARKSQQVLAPAPPTAPPGNSVATFNAPDLPQVESMIGKLSLQPIHCSHTSVSGRLFAGVDGVYFFGRKFFWDKQVVLLKWENVHQVQVIENGIRIINKEEEAFDFLEMETPEQVEASLVSLHNKNLTNRKKASPSSRSTSGRRASIRRMNSDPMLGASLFHLDLGAVADLGGTPEPAPAPPTEDSLEVSIHGSVNASTVKNHKDEWSQVSQKAGYDKKGRVVEGRVLKCSLDTFYEMFLADGAKYSLAAFLEGRGDSSLKESPWKAEDDGKQSRVVSYIHPVNAPLAPPQAGARKEQSYYRCGEHGLVIETHTHVDDVPMADCFYVADRVLVEPKGEDSVSVTMEFKMTFVKSTMFKSIISRTTSSEFVALFQAMADFMSNNLGGDTVRIEPTLPVAAETVAKEAPKSSFELFSNSIVAPLLVLVLLFQLWIILEVRGIKSTVRTLQQLHQSSSAGQPSSNGITDEL